MNLAQTGGCQCGKIRYTITEAPTLVYTCHCKDCQRLTSSAFSMGIVVTEGAFHRSGVEPRPLQRLADSGRTNTRWVRRVWVLGRQSAEGWCGAGSGGHPGRYVMAATDRTHLDPKQATLGHLRRRG